MAKAPTWTSLSLVLQLRPAHQPPPQLFSAADGWMDGWRWTEGMARPTESLASNLTMSKQPDPSSFGGRQAMNHPSEYPLMLPKPSSEIPVHGLHWSSTPRWCHHQVHNGSTSQCQYQRKDEQPTMADSGPQYLYRPYCRQPNRRHRWH